jgi:hypothetical protein
MIKIQYLMVWGLLLLLGRRLLAHLAIVPERSPTPDTAYAIADITLSQAFYGHLEAGEVAYYQFALAGDTELRLSMLVPMPHYKAGFRPTLTIYGPDLPPDGLLLPAGDEGTRAGTTLYQRTQRASPTLPAGSYLLEVSGNRAGVYCFCCGTREPAEYADDATRARVQALLAREPAG